MKAVILFDDACLLCNGMVQMILRNDPHGFFSFAPLRSDAGREYTANASEEERSGETLVVLERGAHYVRSEAIIRIYRRLRMPWPLLSVFAIVPKSIRDAVYCLVARNRYHWFGSSDVCLQPTPEQRVRFL